MGLAGCFLHEQPAHDTAPRAVHSRRARRVQNPMNILGHENIVRLSVFLAVLVLMASWELLAPRRALTARKPLRWLSNLALVGLNTLVLRVLIPMGAVGMALLAGKQGWGLLNNLAMPPWLAIVLAVVALD